MEAWYYLYVRVLVVRTCCVGILFHKMLMPTVMEHVGELYCFLVLSFVNIQTVFSCEQVTMPMCVDLDYNMTKFPNFLGHQNIMDANLELHTFYPLVKVKCSPYLQEFLCRVYAPECDPNNPDGPLKVPIYSLCQSAKGGCGSVMNKFGFPWPERLQCEKFLGKSLLYFEYSLFALSTDYYFYQLVINLFINTRIALLMY